jgi:alpha-glucosidase
VKGKAVEIKGSSFKARVMCDEVTDFCTRVRVDNLNVTHLRNYSDGVLEKYRTPRPISPVRAGRDGRARFETQGMSVEVGSSTLGLAFGHGMKIETADEGFGFNGVKTIFNFAAPGATGFYGFGERTKRFNKSGDSLDFYTVDVMAVFPQAYWRDDYDPNYVSIPLAIIRVGDEFCGLYFDSAERLIMDCGQIKPGHFIVQAMHGNAELYVINGPTLRDVVRNFTELTGRAELPPAWALGYHQCRWGYETGEEFETLAAKFDRFEIPVSALWYDIDYMDGYRVFTWDKKDMPRPKRLNEMLKKRGIRTVAIVDPGVKLETGYEVYESGKAAGVFCKSASGRDYVGQVWPGDTVFPDFTEEAGREWWAGWLARFLKESALDGAWLDMNDPSTGWCATEDMLFGGGKAPHARYHNQYGHFMAKASRLAFEKVDPDRRPFLLTRSGFAGTQRYSAIWTGDNDSNWNHLRMSIPCTINLGLSGVAFNGPDVGGFAGNATPDLLVRWFQAGFLFPFFRNHSIANSKTQEPWQFGPEVMGRIRDVVRTRYRLLPYLYQCFFQNHLTGDPVLRPLLYEFADRELENIDDQFMVGGALMAAPIVHSGEHADFIVKGGVRRQLRHITFPAGWWYDLNIGEWVAGGRTIRYGVAEDETPIFAREGAVIPWCRGKLKNGDTAMDDFELHVFVREGGSARATFYLEDQETRRYLRDGYNTAMVTVSVGAGEARVSVKETGPLPAGRMRLDRVVVYGEEALKGPSWKKSTRRWVGREIAVNVPSKA